MSINESREFYVYEHIRLDKMEPFYIGKGKGERVYDLYRNDHHDAITDEYGHAVVIIADNLTEDEAYWLERDTIEDYVFNLGYGIDIEVHKDYDHELPHLTNMNWGGRGGSSGINAFANKTPEEMEIIANKKSNSMKGKNKGKNSFANKTEEEMNIIKQKIREKRKGKNPYVNKTEEEMNIIKQKISEKMKGKNNPMFGKNKGENNPFYGKNHSDESKRKMSEAHEGKEMSEEQKQKISKKVICITTGEEFNSIKYAGYHYGIAPDTISACCKGKRKSSGVLNHVPLQWKYA